MKKVKNDKCSIWWCNNPHYAIGYCKPHYQANLRYGHPYGKHRPQIEKTDDLIKMARLVALRLTEFVEDPTEFVKSEDKPVAVWVTYESSEIVCPFCNNPIDNHKQHCVVAIAKRIIDSTNDFSRKVKHGQSTNVK